MSDVKTADKKVATQVTAPPVIEGRMASREYKNHDWNVVVPAGTPFEALIDPHYWTHVAKSLKIGDILHVQIDDRSYYAQLYVRHAERLYAHIEVLQHHAFKAELPTLQSQDHEVRYLGPQKEWGVVDVKAKRTVKEGFADRQSAEGFLRSYLRAA